MKCRAGVYTVCRKWHNSLLHQEEAPQRDAPHKKGSETLFTATYNFYSLVLLAIACVKVKDSQGNFHKARATLDSGSQSEFVSMEFCRKLELNEERANIAIIGFNQVQSMIK